MEAEEEGTAVFCLSASLSPETELPFLRSDEPVCPAVVCFAPSFSLSRLLRVREAGDESSETDAADREWRGDGPSFKLRDDRDGDRLRPWGRLRRAAKAAADASRHFWLCSFFAKKMTSWQRISFLSG